MLNFILTKNIVQKLLLPRHSSFKALRVKLAADVVASLERLPGEETETETVTPTGRLLSVKKSSRRHISPTFNNLFSNYVSVPSLLANCNESISQFVGFESAISPSSAISEGNKKPKSQ